MNLSAKQETTHEPVLISAVIEALGLEDIAHLKNQARKFVDATLGGGGIAQEIVCRGGNVLGIDDDEMMLEVAEKRLKKVPLACPSPHQNLVGRPFKFIHGNFADIYTIAQENGYKEVDGVVFDLGISNLHFKDESRGFSFRYPEAPLDMRLNQKVQGVTAVDLLNSLRNDQLTALFSVVLDKFEAKKVASKIVAKRKIKSIKTVGDFLTILKNVSSFNKKVHRATLPFLALRIAVGSELDNLTKALPDSFKLLKSGGRLVVISFHSAEDRIVKTFFKRLTDKGVAKLLYKKPLSAKREEVFKNPKARSAKLRALIKL